MESYLRIIAEPKLPSVFLQVICWVLGEYGTADGKYSASYITGKLCDVAEAYSNDETVKAYAITALMKLYAYEIAAGRKVDILPECQSLIEELSASHSTDLQQRAYELQALIGLDARAVETVMPSDASCEDIEIDKSLSFLNHYVQESVEKGAQPYIPESERTGMLNTSSFRNEDHHEASMHGLRFEAYDLPKPVVPSKSPVTYTPSTELVPVPEPSYSREVHTSTAVPSISSSGSTELKLRLDGVQKKWGRPNYSSGSTSTSESSSQKTVNGVAQTESVSTSTSRAQATSSFDLKKPQVEISPEKQRLAASLFGGPSKTDKRPTSSSHKVVKSSSHTTERPPAAKPVDASEKSTPVQPPPDLLDLGEPTVTSSAPLIDPFKQLEGLLDQGENVSVPNHGAVNATKPPEIMSLYAEIAASGQSGGVVNPIPTNGDDLLSGLSGGSIKTAAPGGAAGSPSLSKGPSLKDSLEKDALVRQMGVTPTSQNPNLFKDLLG